MIEDGLATVGITFAMLCAARALEKADFGFSFAKYES